MIIDKPDTHGPFEDIFSSWFHEIKKGIDYEKKTVCYKTIYFQYEPGFPWIWNDWARDNECSMIGPSTLYQNFALFSTNNLKTKFKIFNSTANNDMVNILLILRANNVNKGITSSSRYIINERELINSLSEIPGKRCCYQL
jgi:hypothetical protein